MAQRQGAKGRKKKWLAPMLFQGSCTGALVDTGLERCLRKERHELTLIIMDNASFHNHKRIQKTLPKGDHDLIPLPPYSPDLNPIEKTFTAMKKPRQAMPSQTTVDQLIMSY
jgi:transposase